AWIYRIYRSQGQTIPYVLVDIATPPTGGLSLFNLYVALSRSSGRETIQDDRLEALNEQTKRWWEEMQARGRSGEQIVEELQAEESTS
ncbi:hypothetical protein C8R44DRAFT_617471, partial [Mycena epipterygia]